MSDNTIIFELELNTGYSTTRECSEDDLPEFVLNEINNGSNGWETLGLATIVSLGIQQLYKEYYALDSQYSSNAISRECYYHSLEVLYSKLEKFIFLADVPELCDIYVSIVPCKHGSWHAVKPLS